MNNKTETKEYVRKIEKEIFKNLDTLQKKFLKQTKKEIYNKKEIDESLKELTYFLILLSGKQKINDNDYKIFEKIYENVKTSNKYNLDVLNIYIFKQIIDILLFNKFNRNNDAILNLKYSDIIQTIKKEPINPLFKNIITYFKKEKPSGVKISEEIVENNFVKQTEELLIKQDFKNLLENLKFENEMNYDLK